MAWIRAYLVTSFQVFSSIHCATTLFKLEFLKLVHATYLGVILALSYKFFLIFGITWLVLSFLFRYASLSSIISSLIVFVYSYFFINNFSLILFIFFVIIIYTHRDNIVRLKNSDNLHFSTVHSRKIQIYGIFARL